MSKMKELSQALDEMVACGEGLIRAANAIREILSSEPEPEAQPESRKIAGVKEEDYPALMADLEAIT